MEHFKIFKLLNDSAVSNFVTRKWFIMIDQAVNILSTRTSLRSDLCDLSNACAFVKNTIDLLAAAENKDDKAKKCTI